MRQNASVGDAAGGDLFNLDVRRRREEIERPGERGDDCIAGQWPSYRAALSRVLLARGLFYLLSV